MYIADTNKRVLYLKDANEIFDDDPVTTFELIPSQFQSLVSGDLVDSFLVCEHKMQHVIGWVPSGYNVMGDEPLLEVEFQAGVVPCREGNCGQMDYCMQVIAFIKLANNQ